jgi:predicted transposase YdaD
MATLGISKDFWRHTRAFQDILEEGRAEGRREGREEAREEARREVSALTQRLQEQRCGTMTEATRARIEALILPRLEELTLALLDFQGADDLQAWLDQQN